MYIHTYKQNVFYRKFKTKEWIRLLGMENYNLSQSRIVLGDIENATAIITIILVTKKIICNSMKKEQKKHISWMSKTRWKIFIMKKNIDAT